MNSVLKKWEMSKNFQNNVFRLLCTFKNDEANSKFAPSSNIFWDLNIYYVKWLF